ncbi:MAG: nucleoside-diphosphate sugar epimerase/dehydratase [Kiritimatiellae bacterium]|nr:nucleoside-diphosphate sugar epimerase/dehydratase [Kiritimatiellia bacterium]MDD5521821.1 nucleoside-diphosphate sugar epimerase/dehydratase [Kiritimatiellia bacterium]
MKRGNGEWETRLRPCPSRLPAGGPLSHNYGVAGRENGRWGDGNCGMKTGNDKIQGITGIVIESPLIRRTLIVIWHILGICASHWLAFQLRFDFDVPLVSQVVFWNTLPILLIVCLLIFHLFRLYSGLWAYFSIDDVIKTVLAVFCAIITSAFVIFAARDFTFEGIPRSMFFLDYIFIIGWIGGSRVVIRYFRQHRGDNLEQDEDRIILVGRTEDVDLLIRGTRNVRLGKFVAIVTDDPGQDGTTIHGIGISGSFDEIAGIVEKNRASCVLVLPPFNRPGQMNAIVDQCSRIKRSLKFRTIPSLAEIAAGRLNVSSIRKVDIEDLLGRGTADLDRSEVRRFVKGKKVMITGAGGSIGQELCRQIAGYEPLCMVLFEISEFGLYEIERGLKRQYPNLNLVAFAGDIRHPEEINAAIDQVGGIDIIYHSAAYKHVPLMESNVAACFRTNVLGTARLAKVAIERKVDRFVMISSDKAVRPTSMMGATKRIAERVIAELPSNGTTFVSVRFGNVLESSGSVIPLFKEQIARGGPVTVTSPDVKRFFMTIPEAVDLVLLAGTIGRNGEIMVLDMGESIKIVDLARKLIELSGLVPDKDIKIEFTGMRPGEKEFEEVMTRDENVVQTAHRNIWVFKRGDDHAGGAHIDLSQIEQAVLRNDVKELRGFVRKYVPENMFGEQAQSRKGTEAQR